MVAEEAEVSLAELLTSIVEALVDRPEQVDVHLAWKEECALLSVTVSPEDMGKIIGRNGVTAQALRAILRGASVKLKLRCDLNIVTLRDGAQ